MAGRTKTSGLDMGKVCVDMTERKKQVMRRTRELSLNGLQRHLRKSTAVAAHAAQKYAVVPGLPPCTAADSRRRAKRFNRWADALESAIEELKQ